MLFFGRLRRFGLLCRLRRFLLDALKACECDEIKIALGNSLSPMKILPVEGDSFLFLVLPVRLKTETI